MNAFVESNLIHVVGWSLVHSVWQGFLIALLTWLLLSVCDRQKPNLRYLIGCVALVAMLLCPMVTSIWIANSSATGPTLANNNVGNSNRLALSQENGRKNLPPNLLLERKHEESGADADVNQKLPRRNDNTQLTTTLPDGSTDLSTIFANEQNAASSSGPMLERIQRLVGPAIPILTLIWSAGVCLLSCQLLLGWFHVRRLQQLGSIVQDQAVLAMFEDLKSRLGVRVAVPLRETIEVFSPVVIGWLRPVVLLPLVATTGLSQQELAAVLAHELAHIRRADSLVNLLQAVIETLLFYHPAVWWLSRRIREERENCCDDLATTLCNDRRILAQALLKLEQARPATSSLAMASTGADLVNRVARLLEQDQPRTRPSFAPFTNWVAAAVAIGLVGILFASSLTRPAVGANQTSDAVAVALQESADKSPESVVGDKQDQGKISIRVIDPEGRPISGARLLLGIWYQETANTLRFETDQNGQAQLPLPDGLQIFRLWAYADGYAGLYATWEEDEIKQGVLPPDGFTFQMIPGMEIGGIFVDDLGKPIEGVGVEVRYSGGGDIPEGRIKFNSWCALSSGAMPSDLRSNKDGRWSLANIPPGDDVKLQLKGTHPDFISDERWGESQGAHQIGFTELREQTAKIILKRGISIRGTVTDEVGNPIPQALIVWGDSPYFQEGSQEQFAELDGSFQLPTQRPGNLRVTVIAQGFAPDSRIVTVADDMPEEDFVLECGKRLEVQFVDPEGQPVTEVYVGINEWRGVQSLYSHIHPNVRPTGIPHRCDGNGVYVWDWAPHDAVSYQISARGFNLQSGVELTAQEQPIIIELEPLATLSGTVTDLDGQLVESFNVIPIQHRSNRGNLERRQSQVQGKNGTFSFQLDSRSPRQDRRFQLKIEAEGYQIATTEVFDLDKSRTFEVQLEPAQPIKYQVLDEQGAPVAQARIVVAPIDQFLMLDGYIGHDLSSAQTLTADNQGTFQLQPSVIPRSIIAMSAHGSGEVIDKPAAPATSILLSRWASIQGTATKNGEPWQASISLRPIRYVNGASNHLQQTARGQCDGAGTFQQLRIAAMPTQVTFLGMENPSVARYNLAIAPNAGEMLEIDFSRATKFLATVHLTRGNRDKVDFAKSRVTLLALEPSVELPDDLQAEIESSGLAGKSPQAVMDWFRDRENWAALTSYRSCFDAYYGNISDDGEFSTDILRPGKYELSFQVVAKSNSQNIIEASLSDFRQVVEVGPEPVNFGEIVVPLFDDPVAGVEVGNFEFKNLPDQTELSLAQFRGSYVLLDFWTPWCDTCKEDTPKVRRLATMLADKNQTTIVSLMANGSGPNVRLPNEIPSGLTWIDGQVAVRDQERLWRELGVWTSQHFVLIDPEGNYVAGGTLVQIAAKLESLGLK